MNPYNKDDQQKLRKDVIEFFTAYIQDRALLFKLGKIHQKQLEQHLAQANELEETLLFALGHLPTD